MATPLTFQHCELMRTDDRSLRGFICLYRHPWLVARRHQSQCWKVSGEETSVTMLEGRELAMTAKSVTKGRRIGGSRYYLPWQYRLCNTQYYLALGVLDDKAHTFSMFFYDIESIISCNSKFWYCEHWFYWRRTNLLDISTPHLVIYWKCRLESRLT